LTRLPIAMVDRAFACGFEAVIDGGALHAESTEAAGQDRFIFTSTITTAETAALRPVVRPRLQPTAAMLASIKMWRKRSQC